MSHLANMGLTLRGLLAVSSKIRNFSAYFVLNILQRGISLLLLPFYTAYLSPGEFGIVAIATSFTIVTTVFYICIPDALYFASMRNEPNEKAYVSAGLRMMLAALVIGLSTLFGIFLSEAQGKVAGVDLSPHLILILASTLLQGVLDARLQILQAKQEVGAFMRLGLAKIALNVISVGAILYLAPSATNILTGQAVVNAILVLVISRWLLASIKVPARGCYRKCLAFGLPLVPHNLAHWGRSSLDRILLGQYAGTAAVGNYSIAAALASLVMMAIEAYRNFHNPLQFNWLKSESRDRRSLRFFCVGFVATLAFISAIMIAIAPSVYDLFIDNKEYYDGLPIFPILLGSLVAFAIYIVVVNWIFFEESSHVVAGYTTVASAVMAPVSWFLIYKFGIAGAALSQFLGSFVMSAAIFWRSRRYDGFPLPALLLFTMPVPLVAIGLAQLLYIQVWPLLLAALAAYSAIAWREYRIWREASA